MSLNRSRLQFENISYSYGNLSAVRNVSLTVGAGEVVCLLGHSGCGKTTLLRIAAGLIRQQVGEVRLGGELMSGDKWHLPPEQRGVGLMFQDYALFPHLTILENVKFGLSDVTAAEADKRAREALESVAMLGYAGDYPHSLSGGEQQRVALARALAPRPHTLLMDEPFSGLDSRLRDGVRARTLDAVRAQGASAIVVTHDPEEALQVADRIVLMRKGKIVQDASPEDIYFKPVNRFAAGFFSDLNEAPAHVVGEMVTSALGQIPANGSKAGEDLVMCVRPHHISVRLNSDDANAVITKRIMAGTGDILEIGLEGLDKPLKTRVSEVGKFRVGDRVSIGIEPKDLLVFNETF
ncbi:ABC transporter ATP-binding protein [Rhodobacteraceae bacterium RKSG542]|nr:ABC transporter ATP-binding protein [Pseudovibrio flavus]